MTKRSRHNTTVARLESYVRFELVLSEEYAQRGDELQSALALRRAARQAKVLGALYPEPPPRVHKGAF